jgi:cellulose synthase/poly-beta-1,6-N-acetylglucosamine synthase-like glycosyltransferase
VSQFKNAGFRRQALQLEEQPDTGVNGRLPAIQLETSRGQEEETRRIQEIVTRLTGRIAVAAADNVAGMSAVITAPELYPLQGNLRDDRSKAEYRTRRIKAIPSRTDKPVPLKTGFRKLALVYACVVSLSLLITGNPGWSPLQVYTTIAWSLYFPIAIVGVMGAVAGKRLPPLDFKGHIGETVIFMIPSVVRDDTLPALIGVIDSVLESAPLCIPNFLIQIVVDEGAQAFEKLKQHYREIDPDDQRHIWYTVVPKYFETPYGTKKKARANQYAMLERAALGLESEAIFIFHLDDDTRINPQTAMAIADFVANKSQRYYAAQGVLAFPFQLARSWFCAMMDAVRGGDDLLRFLAVLIHLNGPAFGFHGENLLVNSVIEARIGWDFGPVYVEDAYFALTFALAYPKRATFLQSCTYGASPETLGDMIIQRRRWSHGLFGLLADSKIHWRRKLLMGYSVINWMLGVFQHGGLIFLLASVFGNLNTSPVTPLFIFIWGFNLSYQIWMYLIGLRINLHASKAPRWKFFVYPWLLIPLLPVFSFIEALAALLGFYDFLRGSKEFRVIKKSVF